MGEQMTANRPNTPVDKMTDDLQLFFRKMAEEEAEAGESADGGTAGESTDNDADMLANVADTTPAAGPILGQEGHEGGEAHRSGDSGHSGGSSRSHSRGSRSGSRKKKRRRLAVLLVVLALVLALVVFPVIAIWWYVHMIDENIAMRNAEAEAALSGPEPNSDGAFYALLMGSDRRSDKENGRSDSIMLVRVDPKRAQADIISIPRDMMVNIGGGVSKINAAYSYGGAAGAIRAVSKFAGVPITHYMEVDFSQMVALVDELGGITVNVPESFSGGNGGGSLKAGTQTLNGEQTLVFTRERYKVQGGDFSRAQAQRIVLTAIINKILDQPVTKWPDLVRRFSKGLSTDMSVTDLLSIGQKFYGKSVTLNTAGCPSYAFEQNGVSYVGVEYEEWQDMMRRTDAGLGPKSTIDIPEPQASNKKLGAASNAESPKDYKELMNKSLNSNSVIGNE